LHRRLLPRSASEDGGAWRAPFRQQCNFGKILRKRLNGSKKLRVRITGHMQEAGEIGERTAHAERQIEIAQTENS
jgi:hypothetical protein